MSLWQEERTEKDKMVGEKCVKDLEMWTGHNEKKQGEKKNSV